MAGINTIMYAPKEGNYCEYVVSSKVVRLSKSKDGETAFIHLDNGEVLESEDQLRVLQSRLSGATI